MQLGLAYFDDGLSFRTSPGGPDLNPGDIFFATTPTEDQIAVAFPSYAARKAQKTAALQYASAMSAGLTISWSISTALNGTYAIDPDTQRYITSENVALLVNSAFTNGQQTKNWPDMAASFHNFTIVQFKAFATQIALYIDQLIEASQLAQAGQQANWPSSTVTINL